MDDCKQNKNKNLQRSDVPYVCVLCMRKLEWNEYKMEKKMWYGGVDGRQFASSDVKW